MKRWLQLRVGHARCRRGADLPGISFGGVFTYPGHIWGDPETRSRQAAEEAGRLQQIGALLRDAGFQDFAVSGGSTPAAFLCHTMPGLTEIRPGTYIFNDMNTVGQDCAGVDDCAARVLVTVVSTAVHGQIIVDGGSKTFSSDRLLSGSGEGYGYIVEAPELRLDNMNEEHGFVRLRDTPRHFRVGDRLSIIPNHICATVNMHDEVYGIREGQVVERWRVEGRGRVR